MVMEIVIGVNWVGGIVQGKTIECNLHHFSVLLSVLVHRYLLYHSKQ